MALIQNEGQIFKKCPYCGFKWNTRDLFISDPDVIIIGYQTSFKNLTKGMFYFNHSCNGTMALSVDNFTDLYVGPVFQEKRTGEEDCPGHCLYREDLKPCPAECECAYIRDVIQIIKARNHPASISTP